MRRRPEKSCGDSGFGRFMKSEGLKERHFFMVAMVKSTEFGGVCGVHREVARGWERGRRQPDLGKWDCRECGSSRSLSIPEQS